ncbi:ECF subfamily RNA polymerase sigma factor, BldN family [Streptomyces sp. NBC_01803]|uniref:ECF subfamily RNA polymerase sigma factor, BldN family n=1 Tax=Streptomyces sp. NBC_01803 TaxID=2975946 RepID=UPI002DD8F9C7|nr:ECF subfamily RNA polymerase sigma factor, BldN family [Streptomyces sp. NBC_01803]WSA44923.1 sigma-70 family RNA polymerase sigma factor [Streptomyces sp. NBC_01803]
MYPHVGVDASGLATLRTTVADRLRALVPTAYAVPTLAAPVLAGPARTLADGTATTDATPLGRRARPGAAGASATRPSSPQPPTPTPASTPAPSATAAATGDSRRMMDLVERAQSGEAEAFGRLYDHYSDTVYRYIYYRVGGRATAEDLTSETFLRALRRIGTFTWQGRDFGAWLVTIARNLVADHFKSSRFRLEVTTGEMLDANEVERSPEDSVLESLANSALLDAVRRLNPQQQECVTLRFLQGLSVAETARVMGKNEGAIKTLQYRAVRTLARLLPDDAR